MRSKRTGIGWYSNQQALGYGTDHTCKRKSPPDFSRGSIVYLMSSFKLGSGSPCPNNKDNHHDCQRTSNTDYYVNPGWRYLLCRWNINRLLLLSFAYIKKRAFYWVSALARIAKEEVVILCSMGREMSIKLLGAHPSKPVCINNAPTLRVKLV